MSTQDEQLQRWAANHLATLATRGPSIARNPPVPLSTAPAVLASVTETRTWRTESSALGVSVYVPPDGRALLAVGEESGVVRIWDPETGEVLHSLTGHTAAVYSVDWGHDRDGRALLATMSTDGAVRIWDPQSGELAHVPSISLGEAGFNNAVSWGQSPDGRPLLAIGTQSGTWIWDPDTGDTARTSADDSGTFSWGFGHHAEPLLASAGLGPTVRISDLESGQVRRINTEHSQQVRTVAWVRPAGESLRFVTVGPKSLVGLDDDMLYLWREDRDGEFTAEAVNLRQGHLRMVSAVLLPDGRTLLIGNSFESLFVLDGDTLELLHTQSVLFTDRGNHNLDWAVMPDGSLMVCASSRPNGVHVWNITLDPPIAVSTPQRPGTLVIPPEDITPQFQAEAVAATNSVRCAVRADGEVIAATSHEDGQLRIWAVRSGSLLQRIGVAGYIRRLAFGHMPDGRLVLAAASGGGGPGIQLWDPGTGELVATRVHQPTSHENGVNSIAWIQDRNGRPMLASGGRFDGTVQVQDPESGATVWWATALGQYVNTIAEGQLADGRSGLMTCHERAPAVLWDSDTGERLLELTVPGVRAAPNLMWTAAWGRSPGGRPVVAIGSSDGAVRIWDPEAGNVLRTLTGRGMVRSLAWWDRPSWPSILVSGSYDGVVRIWDPDAGTELARIRFGSRALHSLDIALTRDGDLLLVVAAEDQESGPLRVWRIATGPTDIGSADPAKHNRAYPAAELVEVLLRLGGGGLWLPLGLLADLVTLTSPATEPAATGLSDARLAALGAEPGITRLRDLAADQPGWNHTARTAFAALLASTLTIPEHFTPPPDTNLTNLRQALANTTTARSRHWHAPAARLREAAAAITDQTITLLRILGPAACAADPLLPLRLAHHAHQLPALSRHELQLLAPTSQPPANGRTAATGTLVYSPGTVGVTRTGPLTRLLPTQLALPQDMLTVRLAESQLLYRQHRVPLPPAPEPVTIILDTTPPTFGPAGHVLRLAAHLITTALWKHGRHPRLITLTAPGTITDLRTPTDLLPIWTSATLDDPLPALTTALRTATAGGQPVVFCTHQHTALASYTPSQATRLLTTHQPPEQPLQPTGPWHLHLPPKPTRDQLIAAITKLVMSHAEDGAYVS